MFVLIKSNTEYRYKFRYHHYFQIKKYKLHELNKTIKI